jgi:hypothetical protein
MKLNYTILAAPQGMLCENAAHTQSIRSNITLLHARITQGSLSHSEYRHTDLSLLTATLTL